MLEIGSTIIPMNEAEVAKHRMKYNIKIAKKLAVFLLKGFFLLKTKNICMEKKMEVISLDGLDCYENSLLTILNWKYGEILYALWDSWDFSYDIKKKLIGEKIELPMSNIINNLIKYYGFELNEFDVKKRRFLIKKIKKQLQKKGYFFVKIDTYYCNWYDDYKKRHSIHMFILTGIRKTGFNVIFNAIDTMPKRLGLTINADDIKKGIVWAGYPEFTERKTEKSLKEFLQYALERSEEQIRNMKCFYKELKKTDIYNEIREDLFVWEIPFMYSLRRVYGSRKNFMLALELFEEKQNDKYLSVCAQNIFKPIIKKWGIIINALYKMKLKDQKENYDAIKEKIKDVIHTEEDCCSKLNNLLKDSYVENISVNKLESISLEYNTISHFYERKDFERITELPSQLFIRVNNISCPINLTNNGLNNCIKCCGQNLKINKEKINRLHLIGYAVWGNQMTQLTLIYENYTTKVDFQISDWCIDAAFGETKLWEGKFKQISSHDIYHGWIFDVEINVDEKLKEVKLPECENIILFSVVVEA